MFNAVWEDVNEDLEFPEHEEDIRMYSCLVSQGFSRRVCQRRAYVSPAQSRIPCKSVSICQPTFILAQASPAKAPM